MIGRILPGVALVLVAVPPAVGAQVCRPPDDSNEAQGFAILAVPLAYSSLGPVSTTRPGTVWGVLEFSYLPDIDAETRTPTVCRPGKEPENINIADVLVRPRVGVTLPAGFALEASWVPPIEVITNVRTNLFGVALMWTKSITARVVLMLRGHGTFGTIEAPITCPDEALQDPVSECYLGTRSTDTYHPNIFGADATVGLTGGAWRPYAGLGYNHLAPRFQVDFTNRIGLVDSTRVEVDLNRGAVFGGLLWLPNRWFQAGGEIYATPTDAVTGRLFLKASIGG